MRSIMQQPPRTTAKGQRAHVMDIYEELGVTAYINANEWYTSQGGSMLAAPVVKAMAEASQRAVRLVELQNAVEDAIARLTQNEAACVTSSATAGIVLSRCAECITRKEGAEVANLV